MGASSRSPADEVRGRGRLWGRVRHLAAVLLLVSVGTFLILDFLPGDPATTILGEFATQEQVEDLRSELGLNEPLVERYGRWISGVVQGDFGTSYRTNQSVTASILSRLPTTIELVIGAQLLAVLVSVPAALYAALRPNEPFDRIASTLSFALISSPAFIVGVVFIFLFAVNLGWFPASGWSPISDGLRSNLRSAFLPIVALSIGPMPQYFRVLRADLIGTLQQDYILMAKAKGMPTSWVLPRHALRPSAFSFVTLLGVMTGRLLGGTVVIETIFALPGLGRLITTSVYGRDLIMLQGVVLFTALAYVVINLTVDLAYVGLDARLRHHGKA